MINCLICKNQEADKTGSHIIPHFILESMQNEDGTTGRDKGITFKIGESTSDFRFGRNLSPEGFSLRMGRPVKDEEIEASIRDQFHIEDNVFCTLCETKLSNIESLYKSEIDRTIKSGSQLSNEQTKIADFFWFTVILRCSVSQELNFKLQTEIEDRLREIINEVLSTNVSEMKTKCLTKDFDFRLEIFVNITTPDKTRNSILLHPDFIDPYILFINQYILLFNLEDVYQMSSFADMLKITVPSEFDQEKPIYLDTNDWEKVIEYCMSIKAKQLYRENVDRFQKEYIQTHNTYPTSSQTDQYMYELIYDDHVDESLKYSEPRIVSLIQKHLSDIQNHRT